MQIAVDIKGLRELLNKMDTLPIKTAKSIIRKGCRRGAAVIRDQQKKNARSMIGGEMGQLIARHTSIMTPKQRRKGQYMLCVWLTKSLKFIHRRRSDGTRYYIPAAIEYGHGAPGEGGKGFKTVPAIPFARNAADEKKERAFAVTVSYIGREVDREWSK